MTSIEEIIADTAEQVGLDRDEVEARYEEQFDKLKTGLKRKTDEDKLKRNAALIVRNHLLNLSSSGFGGGDVESLPMISLGYRRRSGEHFVTDGDALIALVIVNPVEDPAGVGIVLIDENHGVDIEYAMDVFQPLNALRAYVSRRQVGSADGEPTIKKGGKPTYLCNSTSQSKFEVVDFDEVDDDDPISELPSDEEARRELIHEHFITEEDEFTLQNYAEHKTRTIAGRNRDYEVAFGIDVKRITGMVVDNYANDNGFGIITIVDDTIMDETDINEELISDRQRTPGLQAPLDPSLLTFGNDSIVDLYGYIEQHGETGQFRLQVLGVVPISATEPEDHSSSGSSDSSIEEETI